MMILQGQVWVIYLFTQGLFLSPDYRSNFGGMTDEERNRTLEMYGEYRYSLDTLEVVM